MMQISFIGLTRTMTLQAMLGANDQERRADSDLRLHFSKRTLKRLVCVSWASLWGCLAWQC